MQNEPDIKNKVFEKIRKGNIRIKPRIYFVMQVVLLVALSFLALALAVFIMSFVIFSLQESGEQFLLSFGHRGILTFLVLFPWTIFIIDILLFVIIEWLLRRFKFGHRIPVLYIFATIIGVAFIFSVIINFTQFHSFLLNKADNDELPVLGKWYESIHDSHAAQGVFRGNIISIQNNTFVMSHDDKDLDADDGTWTISLPSGSDILNLHIGDNVYVAGNVTGGIVHAYGIQVFTDR